MQRLFFAFILLSTICSCETEVDVVAPEKDVPIAYVVLNQQDDTHYVKVNKLLQGSESFEELAGNRELAEYENLSITLTENEKQTMGSGEIIYEQTGVADAELQPVEINDKEAGPFHHPDQTVYYTTAELDPSKVYGIEFETPEGTYVEGYTPLIPIPGYDMLGSRERLWRNNGFDFVQEQDVQENLALSVNQPYRAKAIQTTVYFEYQEISLDGNGNPYISNKDELELGLGQNTFTNVREEGGRSAEQADINFSPRRFYELVAQEIPDINNSPDVVQRRMDTMRIEITFISEDLHIYTEVAAPSESLLEDKPSYTNFNTGVGVIGARSTYTFRSGFSRDTHEELKSATILGLTGSKGFCNPREGGDCQL